MKTKRLKVQPLPDFCTNRPGWLEVWNMSIRQVGVTSGRMWYILCQYCGTAEKWPWEAKYLPGEHEHPLGEHEHPQQGVLQWHIEEWS